MYTSISDRLSATDSRRKNGKATVSPDTQSRGFIHTDRELNTHRVQLQWAAPQSTMVEEAPRQ